MKKFTLVCLSMAFAVSTIFPQTDGGAFLRRGIDSRGLALGGAYTSITDDASSVYWNPAGLSGITNLSVNFGGALSPSLDRNEFNAAIGYNVKNVFGMGDFQIGAGVYFLGVSDIRYYAEDGSPGSFYSNGQTSLMVSLSKEFYLKNNVRFSFGFTLKHINHSLENFSGSGQSFDFGGMIVFNEFIQIGFITQDIFNNNISWNGNVLSDELNPTFRIGASVYPDILYGSLFTLEAWSYNSHLDIRAGAGVSFNKFIGLRLGAAIENAGKDGSAFYPTGGFFVYFDLGKMPVQLDFGAKPDVIQGVAGFFNLALSF